MTDELVAYLLDDLCPERRAEVERRLATDAQWQQEFQRLKDCFAATNDPAKCIEEPPRDLVKRTCSCVEHATASPSPSKRAAAFTAAPAAFAGGSSWSAADLAVAGGVLAVLSMLMLPALRESRDASRRLACQNNLRTLSTGLSDYGANHGDWLPPIDADAPAGLYAVALADIVGFDRKELAQILVCPDSDLAARIAAGRDVLYIPTAMEFERLEGKRRASVLRSLGGIYAYRVGYTDEQGQYRQVKLTGAKGQPMLSDPPQLVRFGVRSSNHGGDGQNVADQRMCVKYMPNFELASRLDSIFLNMMGQHAAGCDPDDIVLMCGNRIPAAQERPRMQPVAAGASSK